MLLTLAILGLIVVPLIHELPLGQSSRIGLLAWVLVVLALYWLYAGMGIAPCCCFSWCSSQVRRRC